MPYKKIILQPGFNTQATQTLNEGSWSQGNLVKFRNSLMEKIGGWMLLFPQACAGFVRAMHAYADLYATDTLLIGGDGGAQIYAAGVLSSPQPLFLDLGTDVLFSATSTSATVTVTGVPFATSVGGEIYFPQRVSVGGHIYPTGSIVTIASESTGTFTFALPAPASVTTTNIRGVAFFSWGTYDSNERHVQVQFYTHGLSVGGSFTPDLATSIIATVGSMSYDLSILQVRYLVFHVIDANNFVIDVPLFQGYPVITLSYMEGSVHDGTGDVDGPQIGYLGLIPGTTFSYYTSGNSFFIPGHNTLATTPLGSSGAWITVTVTIPPSTPEAIGIDWSVDNFGQYGLFCHAGGPIYQYTPPLSSSPGLVNLGTGSPQINEGMFVAMPQAQIIAYGSEATIGGGVQDPLLVRWSDVGNQYNFIGTVTNQAGDFHLSRGSMCMGGIQAPQTSLIWTDIDLWSMAYVGVGSGSAIYDFNILASGCGLIAQNARCVMGPATFWMGQQTFWVFNANGAQPVECPVWDQIFANINTAYLGKIAAGADSTTQEIFFFYPSLASTGENDSYIKYNTLDNLWDYGVLERTAWIDQSVFGGHPLGADSSFNIQSHETGYDNNGVANSGVFAETGFFDVSDGDDIMFLDLFIPDLKWSGSGGYVNFTFWATMTPGGTPVMFGPYQVTPTSGIGSTGGIRARQIAFRIDWGAVPGYNARIGAIRARTAPAGRV